MVHINWYYVEVSIHVNTVWCKSGNYICLLKYLPLFMVLTFKTPSSGIFVMYNTLLLPRVALLWKMASESIFSFCPDLYECFSSTWIARGLDRRKRVWENESQAWGRLDEGRDRKGPLMHTGTCPLLSSKHRVQEKCRLDRPDERKMLASIFSICAPASRDMFSNTAFLCY